MRISRKLVGKESEQENRKEQPERWVENQKEGMWGSQVRRKVQERGKSQEFQMPERPNEPGLEK